jgi:hypothetical protein
MFENLDSFAGKPVEDFVSGEDFDLRAAAPRLRVEYDAEQTASDLLRELLEQGQGDELTTLVIGAWSGELYENDPSEILEALVASADQLPRLRALFVGDIAQEENEVSWIQQTDLSILWTTFPRLEVLGIRGGNSLSLGRIQHNHLKELTIESGGLGAVILQQLAAAHLPALESLELYLGDSGYGWDGTIADVQPLLVAGKFPSLKHLGLCNSEIADEIAAEVAKSSILDQITALSLAHGTLGDVGGEALLASPKVKNLKSLDLQHHYMSTPVMKKLAALGSHVNVSEQRNEGDYGRYVAVGE